MQLTEQTSTKLDQLETALTWDSVHTFLQKHGQQQELGNFDRSLQNLQEHLNHLGLLELFENITRSNNKVARMVYKDETKPINAKERAGNLSLVAGLYAAHYAATGQWPEPIGEKPPSAEKTGLPLTRQQLLEGAGQLTKARLRNIQEAPKRLNAFKKALSIYLKDENKRSEGPKTSQDGYAAALHGKCSAYIDQFKQENPDYINESSELSAEEKQLLTEWAEECRNGESDEFEVAEGLRFLGFLPYQSSELGRMGFDDLQQKEGDQVVRVAFDENTSISNLEMLKYLFKAADQLKEYASEKIQNALTDCKTCYSNCQDKLYILNSSTPKDEPLFFKLLNVIKTLIISLGSKLSQLFQDALEAPKSAPVSKPEIVVPSNNPLGPKLN